jgi:hypothetical protein
MMPARSNSLFLALRFKWIARSFKLSMAWYSSLGMVKLSRISLGFLGALTLLPSKVFAFFTACAAACAAGRVADFGATDFLEAVVFAKAVLSAGGFAAEATAAWVAVLFEGLTTEGTVFLAVFFAGWLASFAAGFVAAVEAGVETDMRSPC